MLQDTHRSRVENCRIKHTDKHRIIINNQIKKLLLIFKTSFLMQTKLGCSWQHRHKMRIVFCKETKQTCKHTKDFIWCQSASKGKVIFFQYFWISGKCLQAIESTGHGTHVPRHGASVNKDLNLSIFFFNCYHNWVSGLFHLFSLLPIPSDFLFPPAQIVKIFPLDTLSGSVSWKFLGLTN